jgi:hypothetical protein
MVSSNVTAASLSFLVVSSAMRFLISSWGSILWTRTNSENVAQCLMLSTTSPAHQIRLWDCPINATLSPATLARSLRAEMKLPGFRRFLLVSQALAI